MRKRISTDQITKHLRDVQTDLDAGLSVEQACRKIGYASTTLLSLEGTPGEPTIR